MTKDKVLEILARLEELYPEAGAELNFTNPFETLIATILSAQCTDKRVNMVTEKLFKICPNAETMANIDIDALEQIIKPCGLYKSKAKHIRAACVSLVNEYGGQVPDTRDKLMKLPGVGQKTAGVVLLAAFGGDQIPVDTHVFRIANRIGLVEADTPDKTELMLRRIIPEGHRAHAHHLLIWHGRRVCRARKPLCVSCPLSAALCAKRI